MLGSSTAEYSFFFVLSLGMCVKIGPLSPAYALQPIPLT